MSEEWGPERMTDPERFVLACLRTSLEEAAVAIDAVLAVLLEPDAADLAVAMGVSPLLSVDCAWWSQQLRAAALRLGQQQGQEPEA